MKKLLLLVLFMSFFTSCIKEFDSELYFVGSSTIARWDVQMYFPNYVTYNHGRSGAKIDYIESIAGKYAGKTVVLYIGTNDINNQMRGYVDEYADRYVEAINGLEAECVYLFSVFPNCNTENKDQIDQNDLVVEVNDSIRNKVGVHCPQVVYLDVYDDLSYDGKLSMQYSYDGLHLNSEGYELISAVLMNELNR